MTKKAIRHSSASAAKQPYLHRGMSDEEWLAYIGEGFSREPKTLAEIEAASVQTGIRTSIFGGWLVYRGIRTTIKIIRFMISIPRRLKHMFGRGKKREEAVLPPLQGAPYPAIPPQLLQQLQHMMSQQPAAQPPAQPQPSLSAYMPPQQPVQQEQQQEQQRYELATNPINGIILFMRELDKRIGYIEEHIDEIITRLNMVQGIKPMPERRVRFASTKN